MKKALSRDYIVTEAYHVAEQDSLQKLSLRGMARHLGVQPQTLYHYFPSLDDLKAGVADYGRQLVEHELYTKLVPVSGKDALKVFAITLFSFAQDHPSFQEMLTTEHHGFRSPLKLEDAPAGAIVNILRDILTPMVADEQERERMMRFFLSTLFGYAKLSFNGFFPQSVNAEADLSDLIDMVTQVIPNGSK
ncbi:MAG: TetR/AcrR family transcriptional regulator [Furfurilactobacillus sp.]|jgi:AcrR family transcriptional regulator|uniref:TetR/AcrR family transcriptional regulator n=1 Tax=Furfurilactobacillus milii TaxID=2888272 RepID=A0ABT6DBS3_9LACO|nr:MULTISPECIES: TetR/AcrR family transcriptional regulator [Furfurilactobacillus]MCF6161723.1 TetR/AcrR family transcriptional regulator [Furfurilactobacillus milii]MCF6164054.1 TetR/AcrR family transcriptional regulator [Furfurilactobacillus milii]MCF6166329.1 TetR/AcrR family transcriptional regulator [Furfurilactobacillus rossiae]MCF6419504.1 TetR/AcrR family transcriptional regulator [Furfurilactobacillus milii]MCH4011637.1 TetR/AcrR family transcriptional regulator [Furfurilactobacillus 